MNPVTIEFEGCKTSIVPRGWDDFHGVSLCCIVLNEEKNLKDFLEWHKPYVDNIFMVDGGSLDKSMEIMGDYATEIKIVKFSGHYANQKNRAIEMSSNDWVLFMDPDERLSEAALKNIKNLISQEVFDCYSFPRHNTIDGVADDSHGADYQPRLFRSYCRYVRPTHEELVGFKNQNVLPENSEYYIKHEKPMERHKKRNTVYGYFDIKFANEMGGPGSQSEKSFSDKYPGICSGIKRMRERASEAKTL